MPAALADTGGLITSLPETQRYAIKVRATMRRLDVCMGPADQKVASANVSGPPEHSTN